MKKRIYILEVINNITKYKYDRRRLEKFVFSTTSRTVLHKYIHTHKPTHTHIVNIIRIKYIIVLNDVTYLGEGASRFSSKSSTSIVIYTL